MPSDLPEGFNPVIMEKEIGEISANPDEKSDEVTRLIEPSGADLPLKSDDVEMQVCVPTQAHMTMEEVENDDLFDEVEQLSLAQHSLEHTISEQIQPRTLSRKRLTKASSPSSSRSPPSSQRRPAMERIVYPKVPVSKASHRKKRSEHKNKFQRPTKQAKTPREFIGMGLKKRNVLQIQGSPRKRSGPGFSKAKEKPPTTARLTFPRNEVLLSALSKKRFPLSGLVGSQNPPSKDI